MKIKKQYQSIINIPNNITINKIDNILYFTGPLGKTALNLKKIDPKGLAGIQVESSFHPNNQINKEIDKSQLKITTTSKAFYGLLKSIIQNKLQGVSRGFLIYLKIVGIGYRANLISKSIQIDDFNFFSKEKKTKIEKNQKQKIQTLFLKLGYSHDIVYQIPSSIRVFLIDPTLICLFAIDKNQITQIAAQIRQLRSPTVYKGKGIRLLNEKIVLKAGKRK